MKPNRLIVALIAMALASSALARDAAAEVRAVYDDVVVCMKKSNCDGIIAMLDPNYRMIGADGTVMDYDQSVEMMRSMQKGTRNPNGSFDIHEIHIQGDEATVWVTMKASIETKSNGKWVPANFTMKFVEILKRTAKGWKFTESMELPPD